MLRDGGHHAERSMRQVLRNFAVPPRFQSKEHKGETDQHKRTLDDHEERLNACVRADTATTFTEPVAVQKWKMGRYGSNDDWQGCSHTDQHTTNDLALLQHKDGATILQSGSNQAIDLNITGTTVCKVLNGASYTHEGGLFVKGIGDLATDNGNGSYANPRGLRFYNNHLWGVNGGNTGGYIRASVDGTTVVHVSDARTKHNYTPITDNDCLSMLKQLSVKKYDQVASVDLTPETATEMQIMKGVIGLVAQEVQSVAGMEGTVYETADGFAHINDKHDLLGLDYDQLAVVTMGALKSLVARVEALEALNAA